MAWNRSLSRVRVGQSNLPAHKRSTGSQVVKYLPSLRRGHTTSLRRGIVKLLPDCPKERRGGDHQSLFPSVRGDRLSRDALEYLVRKHALVAAASCRSLKAKRARSFSSADRLAGPSRRRSQRPRAGALTRPSRLAGRTRSVNFGCRSSPPSPLHDRGLRPK